MWSGNIVICRLNVSLLFMQCWWKDYIQNKFTNHNNATRYYRFSSITTVIVDTTRFTLASYLPRYDSIITYTTKCNVQNISWDTSTVVFRFCLLWLSLVLIHYHNLVTYIGHNCFPRMVDCEGDGMIQLFVSDGSLAWLSYWPVAPFTNMV